MSIPLAAWRWGIAAMLMALCCAASHAQDEEAALRRWREKLSAYASAAGHESEEQRALDGSRITELGADLAAILRAPSLPGFKDAPTLNLETLQPYFLQVPAPFGLIYRATDGAVFITHRKLLDDWLARERPRGVERVRTLEAALDSGVLYRCVFSPESPERVAAGLPVQPPPESAGAAALLVTWTGDIADPKPPTHVVVALVRNNRVAMGSLPLNATLPGSSHCAAEANKWTSKGGNLEARRAYRACYTKTIAGRPELAQATQQAEALLARLQSALAAEPKH